MNAVLVGCSRIQRRCPDLRPCHKESDSSIRVTRRLALREPVAVIRRRPRKCGATHVGVNGFAFPLASKVKAEAVVTLFSGAMFAVTGLDGGLGANVLSPPYFAVRVYVPPGRLFTGEEADPFARVRNPMFWLVLVVTETS